MARDRRRAPPKAVGVVDGDIFRKEAVRDRPCLGEVKFCCALPKRQYRVQPMINGSKDGGKNGEGAARGAKGMIPMNRVARGSRVQKGRVPFRTGTLAGQGGRPDADGCTRTEGKICRRSRNRNKATLIRFAWGGLDTVGRARGRKVRQCEWTAGHAEQATVGDQDWGDRRVLPNRGVKGGDRNLLNGQRQRRLVSRGGLLRKENFLGQNKRVRTLSRGRGRYEDGTA